MPSRTVTINIKTTADIAGLNKTINEINKITRAATKLNNAWSNAGNAKTVAAAYKSMGTSLTSIATNGPKATAALKDFNTVLGAMNTLIKGVPVELKALAGAIKATTNATKTWNDQNKQLNTSRATIVRLEDSVDALGRTMGRIKTTSTFTKAFDASGNLHHTVDDVKRVVQSFDQYGNIIQETGRKSRIYADGAGLVRRATEDIVKVITTLTSRFAPFMALMTRFGSTMKNMGTGAFNAASRALGGFGNTAASMFARLRSNLSQAGGLFATFHKRVEDSMERSKRATQAFLNSGWSFLTSGYTTRSFGQSIINNISQMGQGYLGFDQNVTRAAVAANTQPKVIQDLIFSMQRGSATQAPVKQFGADDIAQAVYFYASAIGQEITESNKDSFAPLISEFLQIANVTRTEPEVVIKGIMNAATEFGIDPRNPANNQRVSGIGTEMAYLSNISTLEFPDIAESFKMVGPMASQLGASPEDMMALLYLMSESGLRGGQAGRGVSQTFSRLKDPTDKMLGLSEKYGLTENGTREEWMAKFFDMATGELKGGVGGMIDTLSNAVPPEAMAQFLAEMFSENATRALIGTITQVLQAKGGGANAYQDAYDQVTGAKPGEWMTNAVTENNKNLYAAFQWLKGAWFQVEAAIVDSIKGPLIGAMNAFAQTLFRLATALRNNPAVARFAAILYALVGVISEIVGSMFIMVGSLLLAAKAFSLTNGFALKSLGLFAGLGSTIISIMPALLLMTTLVTLLGVAWRQDFGGIATYMQSLDIGSILNSVVSNVTSAVHTLGKAWVEFITLLTGGKGSTETLRNMLDSVFGNFLGVQVYGNILKLRDVIQGLWGDLKNVGVAGRNMDLTSAFKNAFGAIRGMLSYAISGFVGPDAGAGENFFAALGFDPNTFFTASEQIRQVIATIQNVVQNISGMLTPSLTAIGANLERIFAVLTNGNTVVGTFQGFLGALLIGVVGFAHALAIGTDLVARFLERFRGLIPVLGVVAGLIGSTLVAKALIPFDKQLFSATAHLVDFAIKVVLLDGLPIIFGTLRLAAELAFGAIVAGADLAITSLIAFTTGLGGAETAMASFELVGQTMFAEVFGTAAISGMGAVALGIIGVVVGIGILALAVYNLWTTNESFRKSMIDIWTSLEGVVMDFVNGFVIGFVDTMILGISALQVALQALVFALALLLAPILDIIDYFNVFKVVGLVVGSVLAMLALRFGIMMVASIADLVFSIGGLIAQFLILAGTAIAAAVSAMIAWIVALGPAELIGIAVIAVILGISEALGQLGIIPDPMANLTSSLVFAYNAAVALYDALFKVNKETEYTTAIKAEDKAREAYESYDPTAASQDYVNKQFQNVPLDALQNGNNVTSFGTGDFSTQLEAAYQGRADQTQTRADWFKASGGAAGWAQYFQQQALPGFTSKKDQLYANYSAAQDKSWAAAHAEPKNPAMGQISGTANLLGIPAIDDILEKFSFDKIANKLGINVDDITKGMNTGQFMTYDDYEKAAKQQATQIAIENRYKELTGRELKADQAQRDPFKGHLRGGAFGPASAVDTSALDQATSDVADDLTGLGDAADEAQDAFNTFSDNFLQSIQSIDLGQALKGMYDPLAGGPNRISAASTLYNNQDTIIQNLKDKTGLDELPWQNGFEMMMDAAGTGPRLGYNMTGKNQQRALRPYLEQFAAQSGVSVDDLLKGIPMFSAPEQYVGMGQGELIQYAQGLSTDTYNKLDLFGQNAYQGGGDKQGQVFDAQGFDWTELANYGTAQAAAGNLDWNLTDYIMEAWDLTKEQAEEYIRENGLDPNVINGSIFDDTALYAQSLGGQVNVMTADWMDYFNQVTDNGTDKTIEITQEAFDKLPDIVKIGYSNMGYQFVIGGKESTNQIIANAEMTKSAIEKAYGDLPDNIDELVGQEGWSVSTVDGITSIYDELGHLQYTLPAADYEAWKDSLTQIELIAAEHDRVMQAYQLHHEQTSGGIFIKGGGGRRRGGVDGGAGDAPETTTITTDDMFPSTDDITAAADAAAQTAVSTFSDSLTTYTPDAQIAVAALVSAIVLGFSAVTSQIVGPAQAAVSIVANTLAAGAPYAHSGGFSLGSAAGQGILDGLNSKIGQIEARISYMRGLAGGGGGTGGGGFLPPVPFSGGGTSQQGAGTVGTTAPVTGGTPTASGAKTVSLHIENFHAGDTAQANSLISRIDEELGNKFLKTSRGMYSTSGRAI